MYFDTYAEVDAKPVRQPGRRTYIPRFKRYEPIQPFANQTDGHFSTDHTRGRGRGRGRGRDLGGRTGSGGRDPYRQDEVLNQFDELKITEPENTNSGINFDAYEDIPVEVTGSDVPKPVNTFAEIDLGEALNNTIRYTCKYVKPTPIQRHAIPVALAGRDLMACAQTGSGKTAAFCFPIIFGVLKIPAPMTVGYKQKGSVANPLALIMSPTRELCCQIFDEVKKFCNQTGVKAAVAYGGAPIYQQFKAFQKGVDILVATPGRLNDMIERSRVSLKRIKYLVLDEADCMLDMGFEPQIRKIVEHLDMPRAGQRQTMLFSATFPSEIQRLASDFLANYIFMSVGRVGSSTDLILQKVVYVEDSKKREFLRNLLHDQKANGNLGKHALTLVFVETKKGADSLEHWLCKIGFPATAIHGDKVQFEREGALRSFKKGVTPIMVATDVASRGLDIPRVAHVINFDLPRDIDSYVHRIGRTGRAGKSGLATAFFSEKNSCVAKALSELMKEAKQETPDWLGQYFESFSSSSDNRYRSGNKFGGRDFRDGNDNSYGNADYGTNYDGNVAADYGANSGGNDNYAHPSVATDYGGTSGGVDYYATPPLVDYSDFNGGGGGGHGYESVVASGWD